MPGEYTSEYLPDKFKKIKKEKRQTITTTKRKRKKETFINNRLR